MVDLAILGFGRGDQELLRSGEFFDQRPIILIGRRTRSRPGQIGDGSPGRFGRPARVTDQVGCVRQAGAVMAGDAMKENRLPVGIGQQVGGPGHLLECRP
jgi:hypothetical protein